MKKKSLQIFTVIVTVLLMSALLVYAGKKGPAPGEKPTIVFWQNEAGSGLVGWYEAVVADINANEDFIVEMVENPIEDMIDLITAAGVSQSGFDISWDWSGRSSTMMRGIGGIYQPVNDLIPAEVLKRLNQGTIVANTDKDGNIWGVPVFNDINYLIYNKEILTKAGVDISKFTNSWEDFIAACEKIKKIGVVPISFANKEGIIHEFWGLDMMHVYFDNEKDLKDYFETANFNEPKMRDAMEKYKYLYDQGYLDPAGETLDYASNYFSKFSSGKAAFIWFINSMYVSAIKEGQISEDNVGYALHVAYSDGKLSKKIAGLGYCLTVSNWTKYPEESAKAIEYFVSDKWQAVMLSDYGVVPANMTVKVKDVKSLPPNMQFYYDQHKGEVTICPYEVLVGLQYDEFIRSATPYFHEDITYEEFARRLTEATTVD